MSSSATKEMNGIKVVTTRNTGKVVLSGEFSLHNAEKIKGVLLELITDKDKVTVDVNRISGADSSIFQLLCSARRRTVALGQKLVIKCREDSEFLKIALNLGFHRSGQCNVSDSGELLWDSTNCQTRSK